MRLIKSPLRIITMSILALLSALSLTLALKAAPNSSAPTPILLLKIQGGIGPAVQAYIEQGLAAAGKEKAKAVILELDTPGGLASSMRGIIKSLLNSPIPVLSYVAPSGARAASAGTFIVYASAFAAMAPGTHLGAATPVSIGGASKDKPPASADKKKKADKSTAAKTKTSPTSTSPAVDQATAMRQKVTNDAVASIRSLAQLHGRNIDFAERSVTEAATLTATEARQQNVINAIANNTRELIRKARGKKMVVANQTITFHLKNYRIIHYQASWRIKLLTVITAPSVAYFLLIAGMYGLFFEFTNPGIIVPGVIGGISLVLGVYGLALLPLSYAGLSLIVLGIAFMIGEAMIPSIGILGIGGVVAFAIGSFMLIDTDHPSFHIAKAIIIILSLFSAAFFILIGRMAIRSRKKPLVSGASTLIGQSAAVQQSADHQFYVFLQSERWQVKSQVPLHDQQNVRVIATAGVILQVEPFNDPNHNPQTNPGATT